MFRELSNQLDELLLKAGRQPGDVKRTLMLSLFYARDIPELERKYGELLQQPKLSGKSLVEAIKTLQTERGLLAGTPEMLIEQINAYANAGVEELMLQWFDMDDIEGLQAFAETVLPHI
jgi:alkanesulfonate monooxygenase SsuD/methylene tetrahydromethanopterin reductase-like flavin-dependent oxidoreductase (luciferase family)